MSFRTPESKGYALLVTKSQTEVFLTQDEYEGTFALMTAKNSGFTATVLDDGSIISLNSIERIEVLPAKPAYIEKQLDSEDPYESADPYEMERKAKSWEHFKAKLKEDGLYDTIAKPMPK